MTKRVESSVDRAAHGTKGKGAVVEMEEEDEQPYYRYGHEDYTNNDDDHNDDLDDYEYSAGATEEAAGAAESSASAFAASSSTQAREAKPVPGPLVVFSCRHVYHRVCLEEAGSGSGRLGLELACPACK